MKNVYWGMIAALLPFCSHAEESVSLGLLIGGADQSSVFGDGYSASGQTFSHGIKGSYTLYENLKLELSYNNYRDAESTFTNEELAQRTVGLKTKSVDFGLMYGARLLKDLSLYGHFGASYWRSEFNEGFSTLTGQNENVSNIDLYYGLSLDYDMNKNDAIGIEYKIIDMSYEANEFAFENKLNVISIFFKSKY